jgi:hypothetical protein
MTSCAPAGERTAAVRRTRVAMGVSSVLHGLLLLALLFVHPEAPRPPLTEIEWLEPGEASAAQPPGAPFVRAGGRPGGPG